MSNWSELPIEILNLIVEHLYYIDQIRIRMVCKSWRSNIYNDADKLPWIMGYQSSDGDGSSDDIISSNQIYLYEPSEKRRYRVETKIPTDHGSTRLHASKFGWLLLSEVFLIDPFVTTLRTNSFSHHFFFHCPFTNEIIQLPKLDNMEWDSQSKATFSTAPTSSDCVIFVFQSKSDRYNIRVSTCSPGDTAWCRLLFKCDFGEIKNVAYSRGVFYCAFDPTVPQYMGAYTPTLQEWKIHPYPPFILRLFSHKYKRDLYLIDSPNDDKNLLLAYYSEHRHYPDCVFRFDQSQLQWFKIKNFISVSSHNEDRHKQVEIETLNNRVLFCSAKGIISLPAEGKASRLANTIHWCYSERCVSTRCSRRPNRRYCRQIYNWVDQQSDRGWSKVWIQPLHARNFMTGHGELAHKLD